MRPYFGATNDKDQWWDGKNWCNVNDPKNRDGSYKKMELNSARLFQMLKCITVLREHEENNCHVDGVFKCPRCRRLHYLVDTFDELCDGCINILLVHPACPVNVLDSIKQWQAKAQAHWAGEKDPEIVARIEERQRLENIVHPTSQNNI